MTKQQIIDKFENLIDELVVQNNPQALDDMIPDLLADFDQRQEAFEDLLELLASELGYTS